MFLFSWPTVHKRENLHNYHVFSRFQKISIPTPKVIVTSKKLEVLEGSQKPNLVMKEPKLRFPEGWEALKTNKHIYVLCVFLFILFLIL